MKITKILSLLFLVLFVTGKTCVSKHCSVQEKQCKEDKSDFPCYTIVNTCLDLCPSGTDYPCISFCISSRKNELASKFIKCCSEFSCKIEKFTALNKFIPNIERE